MSVLLGSSGAWLPVLCAGCAAALATSGPRSVPGPGVNARADRPAGAASTSALDGSGRTRAGRLSLVGRRPRLVVGILGVLALAGAGLPLRMTALGVVLVLVAGGSGGLLRARRERNASDAARARVLEVCRLLAAELAAGRPPGAALERAAVEWPAVGPIAAVQRLGGDVPAALRELARAPGHGDLALVASSWQVAHASGGGLAASLRRLAAAIRAGQATRRIVQAELASARATARLMAALPVLALVMGGGIGGDPVGFLTGTVLGLACLTGGLLLGLAGLWWIEAIARGVADGS